MSAVPPIALTLRPRLAGAAVLAALLAGLLAGGCSSERKSRTPLFPLEAGREWTYTVTTTWDDDNADTTTRVLRSLGEDEAAGQRAWHRRDDDGIDYWLRHDDSGIWRVAAKSDADAAPLADDSLGMARRYVLKAPYQVGTQWTTPTALYLFKRRAEFPAELKYQHGKVPMNYVIESVNEQVTTPAGVWSGCTKVHGSANVRVYADSVGGWKDLPVETWEWYCPDIGLVRLERHERANSTFLLGGRLSMELSDWR